MKFYIDFEATQPENEIIAVGAVSETGRTFYSLVKPQLSSLSEMVSQLTHIKQKDLDEAEDINEVFKKFDLWVMEQESDIMKCRFISYGDDDQFVKATLPAITDQHAFMTAAVLLAKIEDCRKQVAQFFHGNVSLIKAFNFIESLENEQKHNPLEDAMMLQRVLVATETLEPLTANPFRPTGPVSYNSPSGVFFCKRKGHQGEQRFETCEDAITWFINNRIGKEQRENVHRERIMKNIMKAVRTGNSYDSCKWRRVKEKKEESK